MTGTLKGLVPIAIGIAVLFVFQAMGGPHIFGAYQEDALLVIGINITLGLSLNIVNGFTGQFSIGHAGFMALGAYAGGAITYYGAVKLWGFFPPQLPPGAGDVLFVAALIAAGLVAALAGYLVGLPSLRLRGDYLAIVTLGFAEIIRILITQTDTVLDKQQIAQHSTLSLLFHRLRRLVTRAR